MLVARHDQIEMNLIGENQNTGKMLMMVKNGESRNASTTPVPVMPMATPVEDMIPAPMIWPTAMAIRSQKPRLRMSLLSCLSVLIQGPFFPF